MLDLGHKNRAVTAVRAKEDGATACSVWDEVFFVRMIPVLASLDILGAKAANRTLPSRVPTTYHYTCAERLLVVH